MNTAHNIKTFEKLMAQVKRPGMDRLMDYIRNSDFYQAPASTRYHLSEPGGLLQHSLNVYYTLTAKRQSPLWGAILKSIPEESLILCALCHDFCKINYYKRIEKSKKCRAPQDIASASKKDIKNDNIGQYVWKTVAAYEIEDKFPFGHGSKSVFLLQQFGVPLQEFEALSIRFHAGVEDNSLQHSFKKAVEMYPFVLCLHESDSEAANILETGKHSFVNKEQEETAMDTLYYIERLARILNNSPLKGLESLVDDFLTMLENPVERPYFPYNESCPFEE